MLTFSFKISTLESIPKYAINGSISPLAGPRASARYDPSPVLRTTTVPSLPSPPLVSSLVCNITAAPPSVETSLRFFQHPAHVTTLCFLVSTRSRTYLGTWDQGRKRETNIGTARSARKKGENAV